VNKGGLNKKPSSPRPDTSPPAGGVDKIKQKWGSIITIKNAIQREITAITIEILSEEIQQNKGLRDAVQSLGHIADLPQVHNVVMEDKRIVDGVLTPYKDGKKREDGL